MKDSMARRSGRSRTVAGWLVAVAVAAALALTPGPDGTSVAGTIHITTPRVLQVPGDYPTMEAAVDAARSGDRIVFHGAYNGDLDLKGKQLIIVIVTPSLSSLMSAALGLTTGTLPEVQPPSSPQSPVQNAYRAYAPIPLASSDLAQGPIYRPFDYRAIYYGPDGQPVEVLPPPYPQYLFTAPGYYYPGYGAYGGYGPYGDVYSWNAPDPGDGFAPAPAIASAPGAVYGRARQPNFNFRVNHDPGFQRGPTGGPPTRLGPTAGFGGSVTGGFGNNIAGGFRLGMNMGH